MSVNKKLENAFVMLFSGSIVLFRFMHFIYSVHAWFNNSTGDALFALTHGEQINSMI